MSVIGIASSSPSSSLTLDLNALTSRVAKLLRRNDIDGEIWQWLNFSLQELCENVDFPEMRTKVNIATAVGDFDYSLATDGITNFSREYKVYFLKTTATPDWGRTLIPLPERFYYELDIERLMNTGSPNSGDPMYYWIDNLTLYTYPVPNSIEEIQFTYYKIPTDMTQGGHTPDIRNKWRRNLILMAYFYGMVFQEKDDMTKIAYWESRKENIIKQVKRRVFREGNKTVELFRPPLIRNADKVF